MNSSANEDTESTGPLKEGYLHKAHPKESFLSMTVWQKRYFVLWAKGTLEYYTNYSKKAEDYCGTLNLEQCQDMVAPMTVGKRHNVIKLSVIKEDRIKDYWLDCDCPPVLNEWVKHLADVSGLSPDENVKTKKPPPVAANNQQQLRPLPTAPATDSGIEYELTDSQDDELDTYEAIDDAPISPPPTEEWVVGGASARRYTRSTSLKNQMETIGNNINASHMLKRIPIKEQRSPTASRKPFPPPPPLKPQLPEKPQVPDKPKPGGVAGRVNIEELERTLRRMSSKSPEGFEDDGPTETYEEVQFSSDVVVGTPRLPKTTNFEALHESIPQPNNDPFQREDFTSSYSPCATPAVPPRDVRPPPNSFSFSPPPPSLPPREYSSPQPIAKEASRSKKPLPVTPPATGTGETRPPLPPPRDASNYRSNSPVDIGTPPPPIPRRVPGQSDRTAHKRIQPYRTTEIIQESPPEESESSSSSDQSSSGDAMVIRHNFALDGKNLPVSPLEALKTSTAPSSLAGLQSKPNPPTKPKPHAKPNLPPSKPRASSSTNESSRNTHSTMDSRGRPPALLPKPKPKPTIKNDSTSSASASSIGTTGAAANRGKRPPMPPPKPRT